MSNVEWKRPTHNSSPVTTWTCGICGFKVTSDTHIRFDEMCEHITGDGAYSYPWNTYAAIIGDEPIPLESE